MKYKGSLGSRIFDVVNVVGLTLIMVVTLYPVIYVVLASVSDSNRLLAYTGLLVKPLGFNTAAYAAVIKNPNILSGYMVTIFVVVVGTILNILATSVSAFVLTRKRFPFRIPFTLMAVFTMYFSGGMIPRYLFINDTLGLGNTVWALILPGMISTYNMIIMKNNFESIPDSLEESARMDGANDIVILFKIVLPLSKAILAVMVLMYGVSHWNAWFDAMLFIRKRDLYPLQIILREILIANSTDSMMAGSGMSSDVEAIGESIKYATIVVATAPILCVYPFIQKYFTKGVMLGAVKG
ncbi:carbohydrate ABC transporter permease [Lachnospiraceae bacterium AM48-27BH]|jgi:putative aldouronate transport system permease protein|nr:carbohydrate ABC transporter permease [Lachnospiraceae bacterium AM48-27BH]